LLPVCYHYNQNVVVASYICQQMSDIDCQILGLRIEDNGAEGHVERNGDDPAVDDVMDVELMELPDVELAEIRDGVVSKRTRACYLAEIFCLLNWFRENAPECITIFCNNLLGSFAIKNPNANTRCLLSKNRIVFENAFRNAEEQALIIEKHYPASIYELLSVFTTQSK
jgi:hypothetical protein